MLMPKSNWGSSVIAQPYKERERRQHGRGLSFFHGGTGEVRRWFWWSHHSHDIYVLMDGCWSLKLSRSHPSNLSYQNSLQPISPSPPTHAASSVMPYECSLTVVLRLWSFYCSLISIISRDLCLSNTSTFPVVFLKDTGMDTHKKVYTHTQIQNLTSACSLHTDGSPTYSCSPWNGVQFLLPYLPTTFHDSTNGVASRLINLVKAFHEFEQPFLSIPDHGHTALTSRSWQECLCRGAEVQLIFC